MMNNLQLILLIVLLLGVLILGVPKGLRIVPVPPG